MNPLSLLPPPPPPSTNFFNDPHTTTTTVETPLALASGDEPGRVYTIRVHHHHPCLSSTSKYSPLSSTPPRTRDMGRVSSPLPPLLFFFRFLFPPFFSSQPRSFFQLSFPLPLASAVVARAKGDKPRHYRVDRHFRHAEDGTSLRVPAVSVINPLATLRKYLLLLPPRML